MLASRALRFSLSGDDDGEPDQHVPNQSIAALHALGVSNRQIAALLNLHRDTVNWHVRLLKTENRPEAPPGDFAGIPLADAAQPECADRLGVDGSGSVAECSCSRLGTSRKFDAI